LSASRAAPVLIRPELLRGSRIVMKKQQQKQKHRHKHNRPSPAARGGMQVFEYPFSRMDPKAVTAALLAVADRKIEEFPKLVDVILQLFREKYPPHILSVVAGLMVSLTPTMPSAPMAVASARMRLIASSRA
jgi:hypothetical protein